MRQPLGASAAHRPHAVEAGAAIHGPIATREERHECLHAALSTDHGVHLAAARLHRLQACSRAFRFAGGAAGGATTGLVQQALELVELLLARGEHELAAAATADQRFVHEHPGGTSRCTDWYGQAEGS